MRPEEEDLGCAMQYIQKLYSRMFKTEPAFRFMDDKLVLEYFDFWVENNEQLRWLCKIIFKASLKYPEAKVYLADCILEQIELHSFTPGELYWFSGYFCSILQEAEENQLDFVLYEELE